MTTPSSAEKQLSSVEAVISGTRLFQMITVLLFIDCCLVIGFGRNLLQVEYTWVKSQIALGQALVCLLLFLSLIKIVLPLMRIPLSVTFYLAAERVFQWLTRQRPYLAGVKGPDLLTYAILNNNGGSIYLL